MRVPMTMRWDGVTAKATAYYGHSPSASELDAFYKLLTMPGIERDSLLNNVSVDTSVDGVLIPYL